MLTEGDVLITNLEISLMSIIEEANHQKGSLAHLVVDRDAAGNVNTGTFFVRNSHVGRQIMDRMSVIRTEYATDSKLLTWGCNGAIMVAMRDAEIKAEVTLLSSTRFNAYGNEWKPGMFIRHFAGASQKGVAIHEFVTAFPPSTWPGYDTAIMRP